jgi:hypothetical protein
MTNAIIFRQPMWRVSILLNLVILATLLGGCGPSQRQRTIKATFVTINAARAGFEIFDEMKLRAIVASAPSYAEGSATLKAYQAKQARVVNGFVNVYHAIAAAVLATDNASLVTMKTLARALLDDVAALRKETP